MVLHDDYHVRFMNYRHQLSVLRSPRPSVDMGLQSIFGQISFSYISYKNERLFLAHEIIILSRQSDSLSAMFMRNTRFINLVHCVMKYVGTFKLEYDVQHHQDLAHDFACDMPQSQFILDASRSTCC